MVLFVPLHREEIALAIQPLPHEHSLPSATDLLHQCQVHEPFVEHITDAPVADGLALWRVGSRQNAAGRGLEFFGAPSTQYLPVQRATARFGRSARYGGTVPAVQQPGCTRVRLKCFRPHTDRSGQAPHCGRGTAEERLPKQRPRSDCCVPVATPSG